MVSFPLTVEGDLLVIEQREYVLVLHPLVGFLLVQYQKSLHDFCAAAPRMHAFAFVLLALVDWPAPWAADSMVLTPGNSRENKKFNL